jgi:peptidyl-prolyl cis-trans isomerase C
MLIRRCFNFNTSHEKEDTLKKLCFVLLILTILVLQGCKDKKKEAEPEKPATDQAQVLAIVNGERITQADFEAELAGKPESFRKRAQDKEIKKQVLEKVIQQKILMQAAREEGILDDPAIMAKVQDYQQRLILDALKNKVLSEKIEVTEQEMQDYYQSHKFEFYRPERVWVRQIVFNDKSKAEEVHAQLEESPHRFKEMAKNYSEDVATKTRGGDMGYIERGAFPQRLEEKIFSLDEKEMSQVIEYEGRFYIFQIFKRQEAEHKEFEQVREQIRRRLEFNKKMPNWNQYYQDLRQKAQIELMQ